ncbi:hypothetical protein PHLGIDRAFT_91962 [Phlebiopsis gigantea 11061_1 CR5-6]|uniref:Altered inheritance of mitochondria protein 24, mitochondrial n=1 Tax=Phlebiopsis gigantea (strain 11061_1 CR5-6) TaxID=745531 RepID=A0A0C3S5G7_PHLG1|nr:hypothetical protein PHLGIDRAFT_91962 [Phlebiopsis gigantea 11061_1 CR5-6]
MPPQGAPAQGGGGGVRNIDTNVAADGCTFNIAHRDSNSVLSCRLPPGYELKAKPGSMVAMDATIKIRGKLKVSFKKLITGSELAESVFTGPGEVLLAPETWGDIVPIHLDGRETWFFSKHAFLACTREVVRAHKAQSLGKTLFSGEGLFVEQATGRGVIFVSSLGAIIERRLADGEQWIVDNGHLVAWTAKYSVERIQAGGLLSAAKTDEGLVCRFTGPGKIYLQSRNPDVLVGWIGEQLPSS